MTSAAIASIAVIYRGMTDTDVASVAVMYCGMTGTAVASVAVMYCGMTGTAVASVAAMYCIMTGTAVASVAMMSCGMTGTVTVVASRVFMRNVNTPEGFRPTHRAKQVQNVLVGLVPLKNSFKIEFNHMPIDDRGRMLEPFVNSVCSG